ncbi:adenine phosphoribosyltransferase [Candidatus Woesearchaeota archaeon]|nr:adenine phosphoribosyltransferase [Candidatus Woesearchaeota archaeon]
MENEKNSEENLSEEKKHDYSHIKKTIRTIPDFPKKGIMFRDITTLLRDGEAFKNTCNEFYRRYKDKEIDIIVGIESRGFIFGAVLAYLLGVGFVPIRKPGKLPAETEKEEYELEYGKDAVEIHKDAVSKGDNVLVVDDLIATGGTIGATIKLIEKLGGKVVECCFVVELPELKGRDKIQGYSVFNLVDFEGE